MLGRLYKGWVYGALVSFAGDPTESKDRNERVEDQLRKRNETALFVKANHLYTAKDKRFCAAFTPNLLIKTNPEFREDFWCCSDLKVVTEARALLYIIR